MTHKVCSYGCVALASPGSSYCTAHLDPQKHSWWLARLQSLTSAEQLEDAPPRVPRPWDDEGPWWERADI